MQFTPKSTEGRKEILCGTSRPLRLEVFVSPSREAKFMMEASSARVRDSNPNFFMCVRNCLGLVCFALIAFSCGGPDDKQKLWLASAPSQELYCAINKEGVSVIPNGRFIEPLGRQIMVAPHPFGLALSPDGKTIITSNSGVGPFSISIIRDYNSSPQVQQIPEGIKPQEDILSAVFMGLAISPDNNHVYVAGGQQNKIHVFQLFF